MYFSLFFQIKETDAIDRAREQKKDSNECDERRTLRSVGTVKYRRKQKAAAIPNFRCYLSWEFIGKDFFVKNASHESLRCSEINLSVHFQ